MLCSFERHSSKATAVSERPEFAVLDVGLNADDLAWLRQRVTHVVKPRSHLGVAEAAKPYLLSFLARPFLPEYFPGFDVYFWIDSDVWLQTSDVIRQMILGAQRKGMAIAHESERAYRFQSWLLLWTAKHFFLGYGPLRGSWLMTRPHLNAGIFAIHRDAPHWRAWAERYAAAIRRTGNLTPHDQFSLNQTIYQDRIDTEILPANVNWVCDRGVPMWNDAERSFCEPYPPYRTISALHLAGPGKSTTYRIQRTGGGVFHGMIRHGVTPPA
jgi:hypothetical protein